MFSKLTAVFTIVAAAAVSAQGVINTPASLTQCVPTSLSWTVTNGPFYLSIIPGGQPSAIPLYDFGQVMASPVTWPVNITAGTSIGLKLVDSQGAPFYSEAVTIMPGTSDSCINNAAAVGGSSSAAADGTSSVASSAMASASTAAGTAAGGVAGATSSVAASASNVVSSVRASASNVVSSATGAAASGANSASNRASSVTSAAAGAASSTAAGGASKIESTGLLAAALAIVAVAAL